MDIIGKVFAIVDIGAAIMLALLTIPYIGAFKWFFVAVLVYKGVLSLLG